MNCRGIYTEPEWSRITSYNVCYTKLLRNTDPVHLAEKFGTPLYVYNENILRERCRDLKGLIDYKNFFVNYSPKANSNVELLKIVRSEGLRVDAMSPGEIYVNQLAGFTPDEIFYISNNVSAEDRITSYNVCYTKLLRSINITRSRKFLAGEGWTGA